MSSHEHTTGGHHSLTLVVPVFNEAHRFAAFAAPLADFILDYAEGSELVFVDDGSSDETPQLVQELIVQRSAAPIRLISRPHRGKGAAVTAGLLSSRCDVAAFCDLDLSTPLDELAHIVSAAASTTAFVIGSRGTPTSSLGRRQSAVREAMGRAYNRLVQLTLVPGVVDTQCGAKAASTGVWRAILPLCREQGFAWDVELISLARASGIPVQEIGITWEHRDGSRVRLLRDGAAMLRAIPRIRRQLRSRDHVSEPEPLARAGAPGSFTDETAEWFITVDPTHWWLRSKASFVASALRRHGVHDGWLLDIGAGPADVTAMLGWPPNRTIALDGSQPLAKAGRVRHALVAVVSEAERAPLRDNTARVVCLLDVIEHSTSPVDILVEAARVVGPEGRIIINVPAHEWLWSAADEALGHVRRYSRRQLREELALAQCEVIWSSHVFSWLVLPVWWRRKAKPGGELQLGTETTSTLIDRLSMVLTRAEWIVASRMPLPIGTSILCVARRR